MKHLASNYFWPFGVSLLSGLVSLYVITLGLFTFGISISRWHTVAFLLPSGVTAWLLLSGSVAKRIRQIVGLLLTQVGSICLLAIVAAQFDDMTEDGMGARIEPVIAICSGWNPVKDPGGASLRELAKIHPHLRSSVNAAVGQQFTLGCILSSNLAAWTGNLNTGKAITPLLVMAAFGVVFGALTSLCLPSGWALALALLAALNPVAIYQSSSFYVDGHTASLFTAMLFSALRLMVTRLKTDGVTALVVSFLGLSAAKTSGLFYGMIIDLVFLIFYGLTHLKNLRPILVFIGISALVTWPVGVLFRKVGGFPTLSLDYLLVSTNPSSSGYGVGEGSFGLDVMPKLDRAQIFVMSYFAPSRAIPERVETKFPFWFHRPELSIFEDLTPDPRGGGFGPLYGGCLLLALGSLTLLFLGRPPPAASLFPVIPILLTVALSQTWWARWAPQGWLLPVALLLPVLCSLRQGPSGPRWIPAFLCLFAGLLNSSLIVSFYASGCVKAQIVLNSQLAFLRALSQPLSIHMSRFPSNRIWFQREKIDFQTLEAPPPPPRLRMFRTDTTVALPEGWKNTTGVSAQFASWKKMRLLQE